MEFPTIKSNDKFQLSHYYYYYDRSHHATARQNFKLFIRKFPLASNREIAIQPHKCQTM